jgi:hypothetical protein
MALARIITRSHACSQQLALDLLARGYAVEIVSPDAIPDDLADLELRVEEGPGDHLMANVTARDGERSTSFDFTHHLKSPMADFVRRSPDPAEVAHFAKTPVGSKVEARSGPRIERKIEKEVSPVPPPQVVAPKTDAPAIEIFLDRPLPPEEVAPPLSRPLSIESFAPIVETPIAGPEISGVQQIAVASSTMTMPQPEPHRLNRSGKWNWRAAAAYASVAILVLALGSGIRRTGKASAQSFAPAVAGEIAAASTVSNSSSAVVPERHPVNAVGQAIVPAVSTTSMVPRPVSDHATNESRTANPDPIAAGISAASTTTRIPAKSNDDLIAHDTVTYLDQRLEKPVPRAKPVKRSGHGRSRSHKHHASVAANSVTYLNDKPSPKPTELDSGTKPHSDPN